MKALCNPMVCYIRNRSTKIWFMTERSLLKPHWYSPICVSANICSLFRISVANTLYVETINAIITFFMEWNNCTLFMLQRFLLAARSLLLHHTCPQLIVLPHSLLIRELHYFYQGFYCSQMAYYLFHFHTYRFSNIYMATYKVFIIVVIFLRIIRIKNSYKILLLPFNCVYVVPN